MNYIEVSSTGGVGIIKTKNIDTVFCCPPSGWPNHNMPESKFYHIKFYLKRGDPIISFYQTEEKMMEEYRNIFNKLFNN